MSPSPGLAPLDAGDPSRQPEGAAMRVGLTAWHIARAGRLASGSALGPQ